MQSTANISKTKTIGKTTYIIKSVFNGDNSGSVTDKLKRTIENKIEKSPLKDEKQLTP